MYVQGGPPPQYQQGAPMPMPGPGQQHHPQQLSLPPSGHHLPLGYQDHNNQFQNMYNNQHQLTMQGGGPQAPGMPIQQHPFQQQQPPQGPPPMADHHLPPTQPNIGGGGRSLLESLDAQERLMDSRVLHVNTLASALPGPSSQPGATEAELKQERFRKTVMAAHEIVTQKLYKAKAASLEAYFKSVWKISRAQVYRFLDCATVLTHLEDFPQVPSHERLCRSLKRFAFSSAGGGTAPGPNGRPASPTNEQSIADLRTLWTRVLERSHGNNELITSTFVGKVWEELVRTGQVSRTGQVNVSGEGPKAVRRGGARKAGRGKKRGGRRRDSDEDDDEDELEEDDFEAEVADEGDDSGEQLPFGMDEQGQPLQHPQQPGTPTGRRLARASSQKRAIQARAAAGAKRVTGRSTNGMRGSSVYTDPDAFDESRSGGSYSDDESRGAIKFEQGRGKPDQAESSDSESSGSAPNADRSGSSQIGSMERESWAALMVRSHAVHAGQPQQQQAPQGYGYPPQQQYYQQGQMQLHPMPPRAGEYREPYQHGDDEEADNSVEQGRKGPLYPNSSALFPPSSLGGLHRSHSYTAPSAGARRGVKGSSTASSPSLHPQGWHGQPVPRLQRPNSADPEADSRRAAMRPASSAGMVTQTASFSSDGSNGAGDRNKLHNPSHIRYGSSPSSHPGSWPKNMQQPSYPSPLQVETTRAQGQQHQHMSPGMYPNLPNPQQQPIKGMALPYPHYPLPQPTPSPGPHSEDEEDRGYAHGYGRQLGVNGGQQQPRDPSRSPQPPTASEGYHHQPVPRRHNTAAASLHAPHPHNFAPYQRPESPRLGPSARYPSPSPNHHGRQGYGNQGQLPHMPELNLGNPTYQPANGMPPMLAPPRHIPTPVSSHNSPALPYYDTTVTTQPLRGDSPEPSAQDAMTLDDLANVALMRRMSVKSTDPALEEKAAEAKAAAAAVPAPMDEDEASKDRRGALGFILN